MSKVLLLGSIGVLAETSELQRKAYNQSFLDHELDWYWNVANYCELLKKPGGKKRLNHYSNNKVSPELIDSLHARKEELFGDYLKAGISPRNGLVECLETCKIKGVKVGFVTTTTEKNIELLSEALHETVDFNQFEFITTKTDVTHEKPDSEIYQYALSKFGMAVEDTIAVEDTEVNQEAALKEQIVCYLFAGDYAATHYNLNAVTSLTAIANRL